MIYIKVSLEPENEKEITLVQLSVIRDILSMNEKGEYEYKYGGYWINKDHDKTYVHGSIYSKRDTKIHELSSKILDNIETK